MRCPCLCRNYSPRRVCQVDIATTHEHKHQILSPDDARKGLMKMAVEEDNK